MIANRLTTIIVVFRNIAWAILFTSLHSDLKCFFLCSTQMRCTVHAWQTKYCGNDFWTGLNAVHKFMWTDACPHWRHAHAQAHCTVGEVVANPISYKSKSSNRTKNGGGLSFGTAIAHSCCIFSYFDWRRDVKNIYSDDLKWNNVRSVAVIRFMKIRDRFRYDTT